MKAIKYLVVLLHPLLMGMSGCSHVDDTKAIADADAAAPGPVENTAAKPITIYNTTGKPATLFYLDAFSDRMTLNLAPEQSLTLAAHQAIWLSNNHYKFGTVYRVKPLDSLALTLSPEGDYQLVPYTSGDTRKHEIDAFRYINSKAGKGYFETVLSYKTTGNKQKDFQQLNNLFEARYKKEQQLLEHYIAANQLSEEFSTHARQLLLLELYNKKLNYLWYNKSLVTSANAFQQPFDSAYAQLKQAVSSFGNSMALYKNITYSYFIRDMQYRLGIKPFQSDQFQKPPSDSLYNAVLQSNDLGDNKNTYLFLIVKEELLKNPESTQTCIARFFKDCTSGVLTAYIQNIISTRQVAAKDNSDVLIDNIHQQLSYGELMASLKGNVVYIDVWASWCMPCRAEMEMEHQLIADYEGKAIRFLLISEDTNVNAWKSASKQERLDAYPYNFLLPNFEQSHFRKLFNITTIPRYILLDKAGKIVNADAPRPSDPALKELLNKMIQ